MSRMISKHDSKGGVDIVHNCRLEEVNIAHVEASENDDDLHLILLDRSESA
jgi:hypothetical protein